VETYLYFLNIPDIAYSLILVIWLCLCERHSLNNSAFLKLSLKLRPFRQ
jgi:hypothetical protein